MDVSPSAIADILAEKDSSLWVDIADPTADDATLLQSALGLNDLAAKDIIQRGQRPKVVEYGGVPS